jgi:DNA uptake protein ComE-like DNA-binding protein
VIEPVAPAGTPALIAALLVGLGLLAATRSWWSPAAPDGVLVDVIAASDPALVGRKVDLNAADAGALESLPGVGPVLAERIVAERATRGPYRDVDDLAFRVRGVGPALAHTLAERVVTP